MSIFIPISEWDHDELREAMMADAKSSDFPTFGGWKKHEGHLKGAETSKLKGEDLREKVLGALTEPLSTAAVRRLVPRSHGGIAHCLEALARDGRVRRLKPCPERRYTAWERVHTPGRD